MKQIIPFKKDIIFKTKISEITSISLEHDYKILDDIISGDFIISGDYRIHDASIEKELFNYRIPFDIDLTSNYEISNIKFEIDDFYYELIDNNTMRCNIEVVIDNLEQKKIIEEIEDLEEEFNRNIEEKKVVPEVIPEIDNDIIEEEKERDVEEFKDIIENEIMDDKIEIAETSNTIFKMNQEGLMNILKSDDNETFATYKIYIIRENDTLDTVTTKYNVTKEILKEYNDIDNIKLNDKIIIPCINE